MIQAIREVAAAALLTQKEGSMDGAGAEVQLAVGAGAEGCLLVVPHPQPLRGTGIFFLRHL